MLDSIKIADVDIADQSDDSELKINIQTSKGSFEAVLPENLSQYDGGKFDLDGNSQTTDDLFDINIFSNDGQDFYFAIINSVVTLLDKVISNNQNGDQVISFSKANLSITGLGSSALELSVI